MDSYQKLENGLHLAGKPQPQTVPSGDPGKLSFFKHGASSLYERSVKQRSEFYEKILQEYRYY